MLQKFLHQLQIQFLNINQEFSKIFHNFVFRTSAVRCNETSAVRCFERSAVRVSEISAALSAVSVNEIFRF